MHRIPECRIIDVELIQKAASDQFAFSLEARHHLAECRRCRELTAWMQGLATVPGVAPDIARRIAAQLTSSIGRVRPLAAPGWIALWIWGAFAVLAAGLASIFVGYASTPTGIEIMSTAQRVAMVANIAGVAAIFAVLLACQMVPGSSRPFPVGVAATFAGLGLVAAISLLFPWKFPDPFLQSFVQPGWKCSFGEAMVAIPAAAILWLLARRGALTQPGAAGGMIGALAGLLGFTASQFRCPLQDAIHLLAWHGGPVAMASVAGVWIGNLGTRFSVREA